MFKLVENPYDYSIADWSHEFHHRIWQEGSQATLKAVVEWLRKHNLAHVGLLLTVTAWQELQRAAGE